MAKMRCDSLHLHEIRKWCLDKMQPGVTGRCRGKRLSCFSSTCQKKPETFFPSSGRPEAASQKSEAFQLINSADKFGVSAGKFRKDNLIMQGLCSAVCKRLPIIPISGTGAPGHVMLRRLLPEQCSQSKLWLGCSSETIRIIFPRSALFFFLHLCFLEFLNGNGVRQHWSSRAHLYGAWSLICIYRLCVLEIFVSDILYVICCSIISIISMYHGRISLSRCVSLLVLVNPSLLS